MNWHVSMIESSEVDTLKIFLKLKLKEYMSHTIRNKFFRV